MEESDGKEHDDPPVRVPRGSERRRHARQSGLWGAQLENAKGARRNCLVLDLSASGAKLRIEQPAALGEIVTLIGPRIGTRRGCIVWTSGHRAGLSFIEKQGAPPPQPGADPRFLRGRAEILRRLAGSAQGGEAAAGLLRFAQALEAEAGGLEKRQSPPPTPPVQP